MLPPKKNFPEKSTTSEDRTYPPIENFCFLQYFARATKLKFIDFTLPFVIGPKQNNLHLIIWLSQNPTTNCFHDNLQQHRFCFQMKKRKSASKYPV